MKKIICKIAYTALAVAAIATFLILEVTASAYKAVTGKEIDID